MMILNRYFCLIAIIVFSSVAVIDAEECNAREKSIKYLCKALEKYVKADNGKLAKQVCGCVTTILNGDYSTCKADEYDFPDSPKCKEVFRSKLFKNANKGKPSILSDYMVNVVFKEYFQVCTETDENVLINSFFTIYENRAVIEALETAARFSFGYELSQPLIHCYREYQVLAKERVEKLIVPRYFLKGNN